MCDERGGRIYDAWFQVGSLSIIDMALCKFRCWSEWSASRQVEEELLNILEWKYASRIIESCVRTAYLGSDSMLRRSLGTGFDTS